MSLTGVIAKWKTGTYSVSRDNVTVVDGLAVIGTPTTFTVDASLQPVGSELVDNAEGQSVYKRFDVWTETRLQLRTATTAPDIVTVGGVAYRVTSADFHGILAKFYKCRIEKVDMP